MSYYGVVCSTLFVVGVWCWRSNKKSLACWLRNRTGFFLCGKSRTPKEHDDDSCRNERSPLLVGTKGNRAKNVIAKFEELQKRNNGGSNNNNKQPSTVDSTASRKEGILSSFFRFFYPKKRKVAPEEQPLTTKDHQQQQQQQQQQQPAVQRCAACRTRLAPTDFCLKYETLTLHQKCFICHVCNCSLQSKLGHDYNSDNDNNQHIQTVSSNGKVKFQCTTCQAITEKAQETLKIAGTRTVVGQHEYGDSKKVLQEIGDDLEQAVYFMTPRCATCGGDFVAYDKEKCVIVGRTLFHPICFETGQPNFAVTNKPTTKLPPSFCAKYLPHQIILKVTSPQRNNGNNGAALTSLYFVWKDRETQAIQIRQEDAPVVHVVFSLDEQAPANPNYVAPLPSSKIISNSINTNKGNKKQKRAAPTKRIPLPDSNEIQQLQLELVTGIEVAPRCPTMPEPVSIQQGNSATATTMKDEASFLCAKLAYLKFGLEYLLTLNIPCASSNNTILTAGSQDDNEKVDDDTSNNQILDLEAATLVVTIQDTDC